jgi:hypothetical protein
MPRFLKIGVPDHVYWGVTALASQEAQPASAMLGKLVQEALSERARRGRAPRTPSNRLEEEIEIAAGLEGISVREMEIKLMALGWWTWADDVYAENCANGDSQ